MSEAAISRPWLRAVDLCRHYQRGPQTVRAVDGVNLTLAEGEFVAIVGASGSGKSTLLNLLAGLDSPTGGQVEVDNKTLHSRSPRELAMYRAQQVGMMFQSFNLIAHFTALQNVELALYFGETPPRERRRQAHAMLERLGLGDRVSHRPGDLSGGEQQRVALARALIKRPRVLFADEPTGNLDYDNAEQIGSLLTELNRDGLSVVLVTHARKLANRYAERTVEMVYGRLAEGKQLDSEPRTP